MFSVVIVVFLAATERTPSLIGLTLFAYALTQCTGDDRRVLARRQCALSQVSGSQPGVGPSHPGWVLPGADHLLSIIPEPYHVYLYAWPPTPIIQFSRAVLIEGVVPSLRAHLILAAETAAILAVGILVFRRYGRRAAEMREVTVLAADGLHKALRIPDVARNTVKEHALSLFQRRRFHELPTGGASPSSSAPARRSV